MSTAGVLQIEILAGIARLSEDMKRAERVVGDSTGKMEKSVVSLQSQFSKLGMGLSIGLMIDEARRLTDSYIKVTAQMRIATATQAEYAKGMDEVRRISTSAQSGIEATTMLYTRLTNGLRQHGATQQDVGRITETVALGLKAYGATTAEAASAMLQLSQAFASNRLGGEEFRAVSEAMPNLMISLAKSMGVPKSALRELSIEGKITSKEMMKAWNDPALIASLQKQAEMTRTITGELTVFRNNLTMLVGEFMGASGSTNGITASIKMLSDSVVLLAENMKTIITLATIMGVAFAGKHIVMYASGLLMAIEKTIALSEATAINTRMNAINAFSIETSAAATIASNRASIADAVSKLAQADAIGLVSVAHYNQTRAAEASIVAKMAERSATMGNLAAIGTEAAVINATIASKGAAVSKALMAERVAILERRALAKIELADIDLSIAAHQVQAAANVAAEQRMTAAMAQRTAMQARLVALDEAQVIAETQLAAATTRTAAAQTAASTSAVTGIMAIGVAIRTAIMAHPIIAATTAIAAIVVAIANWDAIVKSSKASLSWFQNEFLGGMEFLAAGVGISLGELVQKLSLLATVTVPQLKSGEFKKQWDELGKLAEQSRIEAAARIAGLDKQTVDHEKLAAAEKYAADRKDWEKLTNTKAQQRQAEIAALNEEYLKIITGQKLSQAEQLAEAERYNVALKNINDKYSKEAVNAAANAHTSKMQQMATQMAAETEAEKGHLTNSQKVSIAWTELKHKEQTTQEALNYAKAQGIALALDEKVAQEAHAKEYDKMNKAGLTEIETLDKQIAAQKLHNEEIGKTPEQIALVKAAFEEAGTKELETYRDNIAAAIEYAGVDKDIYAMRVAQLDELIKKRREFAGLEAAAAPLEAAKAAAKVESDAQKKLWTDIDGFAHTAFNNILDKGKNAFAEIGKAIKKSILDMLYQMTIKKWIFSIAAVAGGVGASGSAAAGGGGGGVDGGVGGWLSAGKSIYNILNDGVSTAITEGFTKLAGSSFGQSMGWSTTTTNAQGVQMQSLSDNGMMMNAGLKAIGNAAAGYMLQKTISGEYKIGNGKIVDALTLAASAWFGPVAGIVAGIANRAFGMGAKQSGTTTLAGQFNEQGFGGQYQTPWSQKGGWFRSDKSGMDIQAVAAEQQAALSALVGGTKSVFDNLVSASGDANKSITGWTFAINRQIATQEQQNQLIIDMADSMGKFLIPSLESFKQKGENLADTAVRMRDEFILTDSVLRLIGGSFGLIGLASMGARDNLVQLMGGIQSMSTTMQSYYQNFFTDAERHANDLGALTIKFAQLGLAVPQTASGFKQLVSSQDLSTASGRQLFAALMSLQGAFAALIPTAEAAAQAIQANIKALQDKAIADYNAAKSATDSLRAFALSVRELQRSLWAGSQTPLSSTYDVTRSQFAAINASAGAGNANAQGNLAGAATTFLDAAKRQAVSAIEYARDFAFVQNSLDATATLTETAVTVADRQLEQLKLANAWLSGIDAKSATQNTSLEYLLGAAIASNDAARMSVVEKAIAGLTSEIAGAVGSSYNQANLMRSTGAAGETALSYAGAYKTIGGSVSAVGASSGISTTVSAAQAAAAQEAAAAAARAAAESEARTVARSQAIASAEANLINSWYMGTSTGKPVYNDPWSYAASMPIWASKGAGDTQAAGFVVAGQAYHDRLQAAVDAAHSMPAFAIGINEVPYDMTARIHKGEQIKPAAYVEQDKADREETNNLLREMKKELTLIKGTNYRMWQIDDKHDIEGMPAVRAA